MGKQGKKGKRSSKNELDAILAQLKKVYIDDAGAELEEDVDSDEDDSDSELNKLLEELFASDNTTDKKQDRPKDTDEDEIDPLKDEPEIETAEADVSEEISDISEASFEENGNTNEDISKAEDASEAESSILDEADTAKEDKDDTPEESSLLDRIADENNAEQDVDDILHLMFASNSSESGADFDGDEDENIEDESQSDEVEVSAKEDEFDDDLCDTDLSAEADDIDGETETESEPEEDELYGVESSSDEDDLLVDEDIGLEEDIDGADDADGIEFDEIEDGESAFEESDSFAVEDEEYDVDGTTVSSDNDTPEKEPEAIDSSITEEYGRVIILDPKEYTPDPLQQGLPDLVSARASADAFLRADRSTNTAIQSVDDDNTTSLDNNDISLLLKFGYGEEVKAKIGEEKTQEILTDKDKDFTPEHHKIPYGYCGKELTDRGQINDIKKKYKADKRALILTAALIAIISSAMVLLELFFDFISNRQGYIFILLIEILMVALMAVILRKKLTAGVIDIIRFEATPYSILAFLMLAFLLCNLANAFLYLINARTINISDLMLFGSCMAFYTMSILISDILNCQRDLNTFDIISSAETLFTAEKFKNPSEIPSPEKRGESQHASSRFTDSKTYKVRKTSLVSGYFRKMSHGDSKNVNIIYILGIVPILSLIVGCVCAITSGDIMRGISSMMMTTFLCTPFSYILLPTLTEFIASLILKKKNSTFIGAEAISDYARTDGLFFKDTDAVEVLSYTEIHPSKSVDEQETLDIAYRVFGALGGPLGEFAKKNGNIPAESISEDVVINSIYDNGIELYFDSSINILIGDRQFMSSNNIRVKTDSNLNTAIKGFDRSVIYMTFDGVPKLGFIITSKIRADFANTVSMLDKNGIKVFVDTYEPQINDLYFEQNKTSISTAISVNKSDEYESSVQRQLCDGSIVCTSSSLDVAETIAFGQKIIDRRKKHKRLHALLVLGGFTAACLLTLLLNVDQAIPIISGLKSHLTFLLTVIMLLALIPGAVSAYKLNKYKFEDKKKEADDTAKR